MKPLLLLLLSATLAHAQLSVGVSPVKIASQKAVVPLALKNNLSEKIESARAVVFLLDEKGKAVGQPVSRWVIGDSNANGLAAGATNAFHFVITSDKPLLATNLAAKINFSRIVLEGGKVGDTTRDSLVQNAK